MSRLRKQNRDRRLEEALRPRPRTKEIVLLILDIIVAAAPAVVGMQVIWRWTIWFLCFVAFVFLIQYVIPPVSAIPLKRRFVATVFLPIAFAAGFWSTAFDQWREEKAAALQGDLRGASQVFTDGKQRVAPWVQIADTESIFVMLPPKPGEQPQPYFQPFPDAEFRVEYGKKGPMVTTAIRDSEGHIVANIIKNHWTVYPPFCQDKNYTEDALEILDSSWHVVFQLKIFPDRVQVQAEWWDNQGNGLRITKSPDPRRGLVAPLGPRIKRNESLIKPIFQYPSKYHWREFVH